MIKHTSHYISVEMFSEETKNWYPIELFDKVSKAILWVDDRRKDGNQYRIIEEIKNVWKEG